MFVVQGGAPVPRHRMHRLAEGGEIPATDHRRGVEDGRPDPER